MTVIFHKKLESKTCSRFFVEKLMISFINIIFKTPQRSIWKRFRNEFSL